MKRTLMTAAVAALMIGCSNGNTSSPSAAAPSLMTVASFPVLVVPTYGPNASPSAVPSPSPSVAFSPSVVPASAVASGSPGASTSAVLDPCTLLDPVTAFGAFGGATGSGQPVSPTDWGPECDYPTPAGAVQIVAFDPAVSDAVFESSNAKVTIPGVGDEAFYDTEWHRLRVRVGSNRVQVSCLCVLPSGTEQTVLTQLATILAGRLS